MTEPPVEGARWGEDPQPPLPATTPPTEFAQIIARYGETNLQRALDLYAKLSSEFPRLKALEAPKADFLNALFGFADRVVEAALKDGRPHSMPDTFNALDRALGPELMRSGGSFAKLAATAITYGDEDKGHAAALARAVGKRAACRHSVALALGVGAFIFTLSLVLGSTLTAAIGFAAILAGVTAVILVGSHMLGRSHPE